MNRKTGLVVSRQITPTCLEPQWYVCRTCWYTNSYNVNVIYICKMAGPFGINNQTRKRNLIRIWKILVIKWCDFTERKLKWPVRSVSVVWNNVFNAPPPPPSTHKHSISLAGDMEDAGRKEWSALNEQAPNHPTRCPTRKQGLRWHQDAECRPIQLESYWV